MEFLSALALGALHHVVASSLPSIDVKNLTCHKSRAIQVEHGVHNVRHLSHPTHWMERRQRSMRLRRVHRSLDYSGRHGVDANSGLRILDCKGFRCGAQRSVREANAAGTLLIGWSTRLVVIVTTWPRPCLLMNSSARWVM